MIGTLLIRVCGPPPALARLLRAVVEVGVHGRLEGREGLLDCRLRRANMAYVGRELQQIDIGPNDLEKSFLGLGLAGAKYGHDADEQLSVLLEHGLDVSHLTESPVGCPRSSQGTDILHMGLFLDVVRRQIWTATRAGRPSE